MSKQFCFKEFSLAYVYSLILLILDRALSGITTPS